MKRKKAKGKRVQIAGLAVLLVTAPAWLTGAAKPPKLVVLLVIDQMRADYVDRFKDEWTGGLARMVNDGAWFSRAAYPYATTVTCPGHATVATGAFPRTHGIIQNEWWDRALGRQLACAADGDVRNLGYTRPVAGGDGPAALQMPTLADALRGQRGAHVVSLSLKARSAIMLGGHAGDAVTWLSDDVQTLATSTAYTSTLAPGVSAFAGSNPVDGYYGRVWDRLLPASRYTEPDEAVGEGPPKGWIRTFPHALTGEGEGPDATFRLQWQRSPYVDDYLGRLAESLIDSYQLGTHTGTDFLAVGFSGTDEVGHRFGPRSQEIHDTIARLDRVLGSLFQHLDTHIGRDEYVVALTADHGVTPIPEQLAAAGQPGGRVNAAKIAQGVEAILQEAFGPGKYVAALAGSNMNLYFQPDVYARLKAAPAVLDKVVAAIAVTAGVDRVFRAETLRDGASSNDRLVRAASLSYFPGRSGDLIVVLQPGWITATDATTHGNPSADDQQVPILFLGPGIRHGEYRDPATPADVAPTLAALCGVSLPQAEGHPLQIALITP